ncbi:MAG TPA: hypothetical protein VGH89_14190, partial [Pseudonocardia sp.]
SASPTFDLVQNRPSVSEACSGSVITGRWPRPLSGDRSLLPPDDSGPCQRSLRGAPAGCQAALPS